MDSEQPGRSTVWGLSAADRRAALATVHSGVVYDLGTDLAAGMPQGPRDTFGGFRLCPYRTPQALTRPEDPPPFDFSMELVTGSVHQGSHVDGLAHIHCGGQMYGGRSTAAEYTDFGWRHLGAETIPPIVARGVLLDVAGVLGPDPLPDRYAIGPAQLADCLAAQGSAVRPGDVVLVRTGRFAEFAAGSEHYFLDAPGVSADGAIWLYDQGMVALGTDTSGTEPHPIADPAASTHEAMLVRRGVLLFEILDLTRLAADRVYEFLFIALPLRIVGGTGSWVRPIAIG